LPAKTKAARAACQKRFRERRRAQGLEPQKQYRKPRHEWDPMRDLAPENARRCYFRFHTSNPCRRKAQWISPTATKWCDVHAEGERGLRRIED
jgi:hypothetical protein